MTWNQPVRLSSIGGFHSKASLPTTMYWAAQEITGAGEYWNNGYRSGRMWSGTFWPGRRWSRGGWT